jgi:hypothetical protein
MIVEPPTDSRSLVTHVVEAELVVAGGGMAGTCCALTAARAGIRVVLVQDRPVLGGNASSEVRLWVLGATASMSNNNRWAREGGMIDEILVENLFRNREGNAVIFDSILLEKVHEEPNITLLLDTAVCKVDKVNDDGVDALWCYNSQNSTLYNLRAPLFCDATGDGVVGYLAGAAFRMGAEDAADFDEPFAPDDDYGHLLGHSIYYYSKDTGRNVEYIPPNFALKDITQIPRYKHFNEKTTGANLWWVEYGGRLDTVHDTEQIKWELWKVAYGIWDYIKNSGNFPEARTLTLEWVGLIPGKRESRRFEGPYMLHQNDIVRQHDHHDAVASGGWSIDLHPADGVYSDKPGCTQWHAKGVYSIPYRCMYSRNIKNLFLTGRLASISHVAFASTRVMATCAGMGQAAGMAAALCIRHGLLPEHFSDPARIKQLQLELLRKGQHIPGLMIEDQDDLARTAAIAASSRLKLEKLPADGPPRPLQRSWAQMLPGRPGPAPTFTFTVDVEDQTTLHVQLRTSSMPNNHTPDVIIATKGIDLAAGKNQQFRINFDVSLTDDRYMFACLMANDLVAVHTTTKRITGILSVVYGRQQTPPADAGLDTFEVWTPLRRPAGQNLAVTVDPPIDAFGPDNVVTGLTRPTRAPNAWVADAEDATPTLNFQWSQPQTLKRIELAFDTDFDHPLESVFRDHSENTIPFCVRHYRVLAADGTVLHECKENHQTRNTIELGKQVTTDRLIVELLATHGGTPPSLFELRCYAPAAT